MSLIIIYFILLIFAAVNTISVLVWWLTSVWHQEGWVSSQVIVVVSIVLVSEGLGQFISQKEEEINWRHTELDPFRESSLIYI